MFPSTPLQVCLVLLFISAGVMAGSPTIKMTVHNHAGAPIELFWINTFVPSRDIVLQSEKPIRNSTHTVVNSYDTHVFMVKFREGHHLHDLSGEFVKGPREETVDVFFDKHERKFVFKQTTSYDTWLQKVHDATEACNANPQDHSLASCIADAVFPDVIKATESKETMRGYFDTMSDRLRNYTCADETMETSPPVDTFHFYHQGKHYRVDQLLEMPRAKIWVVPDFITDAECDKFKEHSEGRLARATVAAADGTSVVSENRKAQQAHHSLPKHNPETDFLWPLYERATTFANRYGKLNVQHPGQEGFTIIQYNPDDEYTPHCDGGCEGEEHMAGGRVFTAVLYCHVPERGGATTFTNSDIYVRPVKNAATMFLYKGEDGLMDDGYTEHSGCPVLEGEKWITTIWMREGVTYERDWTVVDPAGMDILQSEGASEDPELQEL